MAEAIRLELEGEGEGADLLQALAARGITGLLGRCGARWEIEISYEHEQTEQLLREVLIALEEWLREHEDSSIGVRVGVRSYTLTGHDSESLRACPQAREES